MVLYFCLSLVKFYPLLRLHFLSPLGGLNREISLYIQVNLWDIVMYMYLELDWAYIPWIEHTNIEFGDIQSLSQIQLLRLIKGTRWIIFSNPKKQKDKSSTEKKFPLKSFQWNSTGFFSSYGIPVAEKKFQWCSSGIPLGIFSSSGIPVAEKNASDIPVEFHWIFLFQWNSSVFQWNSTGIPVIFLLG